MAVSVETTRNDYSGSGSTGPFAYGFKVYSNDDLLVIKTDAAGTEEILHLDIDYTMTGAGLDAGGSVTLTDALEDDETLTLVRAMDYLQDQLYTAGSRVSADSLNDALDKLSMQIQQLKERCDRSITVPQHSLLSDLTIAPAVSTLWGWDSSGTVPTNYDISPTITFPDVDNLANYSSLVDAVATIGASPRTLLVTEQYDVDANVTVPANIRVVVTEGSFRTTAGHTLTIYDLVAPRRQIFYWGGDVRLPELAEIYPDWWGFSTSAAADDNRFALREACLAVGTDSSGIYGQIISIGVGDYTVSTGVDPLGINISDVIKINKIGVRIRGFGGYGSKLTVTGNGRFIVWNTDADKDTGANRRREQWVQDLRIIHESADPTANTAVAIETRGCSLRGGVTRCEIRYFETAILCTATDNCLIERNLIRDNGYGVHVPQYWTTLTPQLIKIFDNTFNSNIWWGIYGVCDKWSDIYIIQNDFGRVAAAHPDGYVMWGSGATATCNGFNFIRNSAESLESGDYFLYMPNNTAKSQMVNILENHCSSTNGIHFSLENADYVLIAGNRSGATVAGGGNGLVLSANVRYVSRTGNQWADEASISDGSKYTKVFGKGKDVTINPFATDLAQEYWVLGEAYPRLKWTTNGSFRWGPGTTDYDVQINRSDVGEVCVYAGGRMAMDRLRLNVLAAEPTNLANGDIVYANGTTFDPLGGAGAGFYGRIGGSWVKLT